MTRGRYVSGEDINRVNRLAIEQKERIAALEAAARAVETDAATSGEALHVLRMRNGDLQDERDRFRARAAALEAAARAIVADCRVPRGDYLGDACRWCDNTIDRDGHRPGCPVGVLEAALEVAP
jgi:hypothetical protein